MDPDRLNKARLPREYNAYSQRFSAGTRRGPDTYRPDLFIERLKSAETPSDLKNRPRPIDKSPQSKSQPNSPQSRGKRKLALNSRFSRRHSENSPHLPTNTRSAEASRGSTPVSTTITPSSDVSRAINLLEELKKVATPEELLALHKALLPSQTSSQSQRQGSSATLAGQSRMSSLPQHPSRRASHAQDDDWHPPTSTTRADALALLKGTASKPDPDVNYAQTGVYRHGTLRITNGAASPELTADSDGCVPLPSPRTSGKLPGETAAGNAALNTNEIPGQIQEGASWPAAGQLEIDVPANSSSNSCASNHQVPLPDDGGFPSESSCTQLADESKHLGEQDNILTPVAVIEATTPLPSPPEASKSLHLASQLSYDYTSECLELPSPFDDDDNDNDTYHDEASEILADARQPGLDRSQLFCNTLSDDVRDQKASYDSGYGSDCFLNPVSTSSNSSDTKTRPDSDIASTADSASCYTRSPSLHSPRGKWLPFFGEPTGGNYENNASQTTGPLRHLPFQSTSSLDLHLAAPKAPKASTPIKTVGALEAPSVRSKSNASKPNRLQKAMPTDLRNKRKDDLQVGACNQGPVLVQTPRQETRHSKTVPLPNGLSCGPAVGGGIAMCPEGPTTPTEVFADLLSQHARTSIAPQANTAGPQLPSEHTAGMNRGSGPSRIDASRSNFDSLRSKSLADLGAGPVAARGNPADHFGVMGTMPAPLSLSHRVSRQSCPAVRPSSSPKLGMDEAAATQFARNKSRDVFNMHAESVQHAPRMATPTWQKSKPLMASNGAVEDLFPGWRAKSDSPVSPLPPANHSGDLDGYMENVPPMPQMPNDVQLKVQKAQDVINRKRNSPKHLHVAARKATGDYDACPEPLNIAGHVVTSLGPDVATGRTNATSHPARKFACAPRNGDPSTSGSVAIPCSEGSSAAPGSLESREAGNIDPRLAIPKSLLPSPTSPSSAQFQKLRPGPVVSGSAVLSAPAVAPFQSNHSDFRRENKENRPGSTGTSSTRGSQIGGYCADDSCTKDRSSTPSCVEGQARRRAPTQSSVKSGLLITEEQRRQVHKQLTMANLCGNADQRRHRTKDAMSDSQSSRSGRTDSVWDRYSGGLSYGWDPEEGFVGSAGTRDRRSPSPTKNPRDSKAYGLDLSDVPFFLRRP